jgi:glycolate oxidase FAD binding subunit
MLRPTTPAELQEVVTGAWAAAGSLEVRGGGSKDALGRAAPAAQILDLSAFAGIVDYDPAELVLTARAATPMTVVQAALAESAQHFAFEPPDYGHLLGSERTPTLGGTLATNLSGSRRVSAGAARDHFLGLQAVSGRGEPFKSGGRVVKNVTGYDLSKLLAGSFGTLAVLTEVTVKVMPAPEETNTVLVHGLSATDAVQWMTRLTGSPVAASGLAHVALAATRRSVVQAVRAAGASVTALRLEGIAASVAARLDMLRNGWLDDAGRGYDTTVLGSTDSRALWREITDCRLLPPKGVVWKLSVPPARGAAVAARLAERVPCEVLLDWAGGLVWVALDDEDAREAVVRGTFRDCGGHATLIRASAAERRRCPVFEPQAPALAALTRRIKDAFDPNDILNPGRMVAAQL